MKFFTPHRRLAITLDEQNGDLIGWYLPSADLRDARRIAEARATRDRTGQSEWRVYAGTKPSVPDGGGRHSQGEAA